MKCAICGNRKGRRECPAKASLICPECCGTKRVLEILCPESCGYLVAGRENDIAHNRSIIQAHIDPAAQNKRNRIVEEHGDLLSALEYPLGEQRRSSRSFDDRMALEAVTLVLETLRTEDRGIIYERTSNHPEVDSVRRQLWELVQSLRFPRERNNPPLRLGIAVECLEFIQGTIEAVLRAGDGHRGYVDFLCRLLPGPDALADRGSSLIVPGR